MEETGAALRCDLHVHSIYSGRTDLPILGQLGNECYSAPEAVYDVARRRGMNLVTITDHDSIGGVTLLADRPDVFMSEEVTCTLPGGRTIHLGVYDITEGQHAEISRRRQDAESLFAYLSEEGIPAAVNHLFSALTGRRAVADFHLPLSQLSLIETRNGMMPEKTNAFAVEASRGSHLSQVGGSDAHTLESVARAWTAVKGARDKQEFLDGLRRGLTIPGGGSGSYARLTADVTRIFANGYLDVVTQSFEGARAFAKSIAMLACLPLVPLIPLVTAAIYVDEQLFALRYHRRYQASRALLRKAPRARGPFGAAPAPTSVA